MKSLAKEELAQLLAVAARHDAKDALMLRVAFNHGLRMSEVLALTGENIVDGHLVVQRLKNSNLTSQPLLADEKEGIDQLVRDGGRFFPISRTTAHRRMQRYGAEAGIPKFKRHMHVLKHTCGRLGYKGGMGIPELVTYLGHKNPGNSLKYMEADEAQAAAAFAAAVGK